MEKAEPESFHRAQPGLFVLQTSLIIASIIVIALSLSIPQNGPRCVFGVTPEYPNGRGGVCAFTSVVSFVALLLSVIMFGYARWKAKAEEFWTLSEDLFFRQSVVSFLMGGIWFLDACLVSGYFDLTCSFLSKCRVMNGWNVGGWVVTAAWVHVTLWFFAFFVYFQMSKKVEAYPDERVKYQAEEFGQFEQAEAQWTVSASDVVKGPSPYPGQPATETITLKCNDPNPFTIVIYGVSDDGRQGHLPICERVTINGERINPDRYPRIANALRRSTVPHQEDGFAVDRAVQILDNASDGPFLASAGLPLGQPEPEMDRFRQPSREERKASVAGGGEQERLRQRLLESERQNMQLQRELEERKTSVAGGGEQERLRQRLLESERQNMQLQRELEERKQAERREAENASGRARAQSEQEREASRLLQQMVELEAQQQKQHADQIATLERQIAQLKRGGPGSSPAGKQVWEGDADPH